LTSQDGYIFVKYSISATDHVKVFRACNKGC
jgi:hypothetical protein